MPSVGQVGQDDMTQQEFIDMKAAIAQMEIHRLAHEARKEINRMVHFKARSEGQKRRFNKYSKPSR